MNDIIAHLKKEWKRYIMALWMIAVTGFMVHLNNVVQDVKQTSIKVSSDVDSVESVLISTDANVAEMKKQVKEMSAKVSVIHNRVRRR